MAQPQMSPITCSQCDGWYASERELKDHMQMAHRRSVPEQSPVQRDGTQPDSRENQRGTPK
jgi:hypothetical protein